MSIQDLFEGYETIEFDSVQLTEEDLRNKKIYLFQAPSDFNAQKLQGITIDLKTDENQEFPEEGKVETLVISKQEKETQKYLKKQILPLFPIKSTSALLLDIMADKKVSGFYKIFKKISLPSISKKAIRKTKPVNKMNARCNYLKF